jgi:hypothetical protein
MTATTYRGAKEIAADIRAAIRKATKTEGDVLFGLPISVRTQVASLMQAVEITLRMATDTLQEPDPDAPEWNPTGQRWTAQAGRILARIYELAAEGLAWADGRHHFCNLSTESGTCCPLPHQLWEIELAHCTEDDVDPRLRDEHDDVAETETGVDVTGRPVLHLITADEALILEALASTYGDTAKQVAQLAIEAGTQTDTIADPKETARRFRAVYAALGVEPPA